MAAANIQRKNGTRTTALPTNCAAAAEPFGSSSTTRMALHSHPQQRGGASSRVLSKSAIAAALVVVLGTWMLYQIGTNSQKSRVRNKNSSHNFCLDPDDVRDDEPKLSHCECPDPTRPLPRAGDTAWKAHHKLLVEDAQYAAASSISGHDAALDLVMVGDSITERWNRTRRAPPFLLDEDYRSVFERYFVKTRQQSIIDGGGSNHETLAVHLQGLALGTSGDISMELLWHLQNGMMPDTLRPKVWMILIGTNDLGRSGCSKSTVLAGILQIAEFVRQQRPGTPIVLHGLMPRNDVFAPAHLQTDYTLNRHWKDIQWINERLARFGDLHHEWTYLECNDLFLQTIQDPITGINTTLVNKEFMPDSLHPNVAGYEAWGERIVEHMLKIIPSTR